MCRLLNLVIVMLIYDQTLLLLQKEQILPNLGIELLYREVTLEDKVIQVTTPSLGTTLDNKVTYHGKFFVHLNI